MLMSGWFGRVLEIGSYRAYSTAVFLEALEAGKVREVHVCDLKPTLDLQWAIAGCRKKDKVTLHKCSSVELLDRDTKFDLVFVDGDHSLQNVLAETERVVPAGFKCVVAHDVASAGRYPDCDGPQHLLLAMQKANYFCCVDQLIREGERTERGLMVACKTQALWRVAVEGLCRHC